MARIRLNNEYRNKVAQRIKIHLQQEDTQEKRRYDSLKADQIQSNRKKQREQIEAQKRRLNQPRELKEQERLKKEPILK